MPRRRIDRFYHDIRNVTRLDRPTARYPNVALVTDTIDADIGDLRAGQPRNVSLIQYVVMSITNLQIWPQLQLTGATSQIQYLDSGTWTNLGQSGMFDGVTGMELVDDNSNLLTDGLILLSLSRFAIENDVDGVFRDQIVLTDTTDTLTINLAFDLKAIVTSGEFFTFDDQILTINDQIIVFG